ncbi:MAG: phospholipase D-like domain-containing protein, partial [Eggerthellaceae bacterium]|nr:phospholipase D-like domain-containing protein [Eggerthellaceae bacterium]
MGNVEYSVVDFTNTLQSSFIDSQIESDQRYAPRVVSNSSRAKANVLSVIKGELATCESFDFSVAFVTSSGIQVLVQILSELRCRGVRGRVLTSTLNNFNDPDALRKLLEFPNIETRIYQGNLHAKGYLFDKGEISTIIVGS